MTAHPMHRVTAFSITGPHELEVVFDDGLVRRINFRPVLEGELFGRLTLAYDGVSPVGGPRWLQREA